MSSLFCSRLSRARIGEFQIIPKMEPEDDCIMDGLLTIFYI